MKKLIVFIMLIYCKSLSADELAYGLITTHLIDAGNMPYEGCLDQTCRTIYNPIIAYRFKNYKESTYLAHTVLAGLNSIHNVIGGYYFSFGSKANKHSWGMVGGAYLQDNKSFREKLIVPFSAYERNNTGVVPVFGMEYQYYLQNNLFISTLFTPVIANLGFGISW
jgi:hypothetical protein